MNLKKLVQGTVFSAAVAVCMATGVMTVKAENGAFTDSGVSSVSIDTTKQTLTATGSNGELLVGVGKVNNRTKAITVPTWDVYDGSSPITIDLSKLSNTKDNYIVLSANGKSAVSVIKIPAAAKAISATFDASTGDLKVGTGTKPAEAKSAAAPITTDAYEYRTAYGSWTNLYASSKQVDLTTYQNQGATLYIRARGASGTSSTATSTSITSQGQDAEELKYNGETVKTYDAVALPSKEAKLNIAAKAKGPNVALDYAKGSVTLPKNSEYRGVNSTSIKWDASVANTAVQVGDKAAKTDVKDIFTKLGESSANEMTLEVRTIATAGKKAASKWNRVKIGKPVALDSTLLTVGQGSNVTAKPSTPDTTYGGKGIADSSVIVKESASDTSSVLDISYAVVKKKDVIKITNNGAKTYEIVTAEGKDTTKPADGAKVTKIAPKKTVTIGGVKDESSVFIRVAGDKKTQTWVGEYAKLGVVDYEKKTEPAASGN